MHGVGPADDGGDRSVDSQILARLRAGNDAAYEEVVRAFGGRLLAVCRRLLANDEDAQDAVQETFLSAFKAIDRFNADARLSTWLHRIAVNAALMKLRTRRRRPEEPLDPLLPAFKEDGHHEERFQTWAEPPDVAMRRAERQALVRQCIDTLPERYRTVLLLRDIDEMDTNEVASLLGITPNAVKIRLHRARQALRSLLDPHFRGGDA
jgi:RNA polymerase sigma-70 factor (ECF subfamily)